MNDLAVNPFQELYLTEALKDPELYLSWFSPTIITGQTEALFRVGNVVLSGTNGTGKTMLLRLFSPEVQAAYIRLNPGGSAEAIPRRLLGVGVNFVHAGFSSLGKRTLRPAPEENLEVWSLLLGDLINYYLVNELIGVLRFLQTDEGRPLASFLGANVDDDRFAAYAVWLSAQPSWFGWLHEVTSVDQLQTSLQRRLSIIRSFVNWNTEQLPDAILGSKTEIGRPVTDARLGLERFDILPAAIPLCVTIDQYETLLHIDYGTQPDPQRSIGHSFCRVVNTFLARRDPNVSYKVGVRPYSWGRELRTHGSDAQLKLGRDYQRVDLDELLRRGEDTSSWIFPSFAKDVAARRLTATLKGEAGQYENWLPRALEPLEPGDEIRKYCGGRLDAVIPRLGDWPGEWRALLRRKQETDPFGALLTEVWMLQEQSRTGALPPTPPPDDRSAPWNRPYWQKERKDALLTQIASQCRQRKLYAGWPTVLTLSGGNILVFLSLCREIWDLAQRSASKTGEITQKFTAELQSQAIWSVSSAWVRKQEEFPGGGSRRRFITRLGVAIRKALIADKTLSYPGHTGFSLAQEDVEAPEMRGVKDFLDSAADFGALVKLRHTTKERDRQLRQKWYLFPVLCPHFEIPPARTKEPYYASPDEVRTWVDSDGPLLFSIKESRRSRRRRVDHPDLFQ